MITDRPQVITSEVGFEFDDERVLQEVTRMLGDLPTGQRLPTYTFPFTLSDAALGPDRGIVDELLASGYSTVMRLPLRAGVDRAEVEQHLQDNLAPQLMLFLRSLEELHLSGTANDFVAFVTRETKQDGVEQVLLEADGTSTEWLVYTRQLPVERDLVDPMGEGWKQVHAVGTAVAVPLGADETVHTERTYPLHVYFPTEEEAGSPSSRTRTGRCTWTGASCRTLPRPCRTTTS